MAREIPKYDFFNKVVGVALVAPAVRTVIIRVHLFLECFDGSTDWEDFTPEDDAARGLEWYLTYHPVLAIRSRIVERYRTSGSGRQIVVRCADPRYLEEEGYRLDDHDTFEDFIIMTEDSDVIPMSICDAELAEDSSESKAIVCAWPQDQDAERFAEPIMRMKRGVWHKMKCAQEKKASPAKA